MWNSTKRSLLSSLLSHHVLDPLSWPPSPRRPYWPDGDDGESCASLQRQLSPCSPSFPPPHPSHPLSVQLERGIIILTGLTGRGRKAGTWIVECVKGRAGGGGSDISVCLIVALILWQWHAVNSRCESLRPPGPISAQELVRWHFYTDILTSNTVEQYRRRLWVTVLNHISTDMETLYCIYIMAVEDTHVRLAGRCPVHRWAQGSLV